MNRLLVWNGSSGKSAVNQEILSTIRSCDSTSTVDLASGINLQAELKRAVEQGCQTVIVAGGDGTVNAAVNGLMTLDIQQRPRMAILPLGTANDFAGTLEIPNAIDQAVALLDTDQVASIDVVRIRSKGFERFYANVAAGGNSVRVSEEMTEEMKSTWGAFCYLRGGLEVLTDLETFQISAQVDQEKLDDIGTWAVLVANGRTNAGRIMVAPKASPVDGLLDVIIIRDGSVMDIVDIVSRALLGSYLESEQVVYRQAKRLQLHSVPGMRFTIDGELIDQEPVEFEVIPGAISMYVGSQFLVEHSQVLPGQATAALGNLSTPAAS